MKFPLPADLFLALRYLRPKRTFVSVITLLSILGPVLGVALLVVVTAIMSGFDRDIRKRILDMQAHIQIFAPSVYTPGQVPVIADPDTLRQAVEALGAHAAPVIEGPVLVQVRDQVAAKYVKGIVPAYERQVCSLLNPEQVRGRADLQEGEALIGEEMALELGIGLGDHILIHSPQRLTENIDWGDDGKIVVRDPEEAYLPEEVTVAGIFSAGVYEFDAGVLFLGLDQAAELFGLPWGSATAVRVRAPDPFALQPLVDALSRQFSGYRLLTWQDANQQLFGALRVEKNLMFFLLFFIVIVAAFGIAGTLITVVVQKTREIGILKAVGMPGGVIARIFLCQGAVIGLLGTASGTALGWLIVHYRNPIAAALGVLFGVEVFPKKLYHLSQIPAYLTRGDVLLIVGVSVALCIGGAVIPALFAAHLSPADALREEN